MAGYIPLQGPGDELRGPGIGGFFKYLSDSRARSQEQKSRDDERRANMLLQREQLAAQTQDRQARLGMEQQRFGMDQQQFQSAEAGRQLEVKKKISDALDAGRPDLAKQIASTYGIQLDSPQVQDPRDTLMKPSLEVPSEHANPPGDLDIDVADKDSPRYDPSAVAKHEADIAAYTSRQMAPGMYAEPTRFEPQGLEPPKSNGKYRIAGDEYDPAEVLRSKQAMRDRDADRTRKAFGPLGYGDMAAALAEGSTADKPIDISTLISKQMERDTAREVRTDEKTTERDFRREENEKYRKTFEQSKTLTEILAEGRVKAARESQESATKQDAAVARDQSIIDRKVKALDQVVNLKAIVSANDALHSAMGNITSDNPLAHKDAQIQLAKAIRGTTPTVSEEQMLFHELGGVADKIPQFWAKLENGDLSPVQLKMVQDAIGGVQGHVSSQLDHAYQSYKEGLGGDAALGNLGGTVNAQVRARFKRVGRDVPDVFPNASGTEILGGARAEAKKLSASRADALIERTGTGEPPGAPEDVNSAAPLPEDPDADEAPPITGGRPQRAQRPLAPVGISREAAIKEARRRGLIK